MQMRPIGLWAAVLLALLVAESNALAATSSWTGGSGNWSDSSHWTNGVPTSTTDAAVSPSSAATITLLAGESDVAQSLTLGGNATLSVQLGSTSSFGTLTITNAAALAGTFQAVLVNGYVPATTDAFVPITFSSYTGSFSSYSLPSGSGYNIAAAPSFTNMLLAAAPISNPTMTINAGTVLHAAATIVMGTNLENNDPNVTSSQTKTMITAAGLKSFRCGAGSATDGQHFNVNNTSVSVGQLVQVVDSVGGVGLVTMDYGSASPQEGAAELAYVLGSPSDPTPIGNGPQWNDSANQWVNVNWKTVGYWAALRAPRRWAPTTG